jgi:hypothetical protein
MIFNRIISFFVAIVTAFVTYCLWNTPSYYFLEDSNLNDGIVLIGCGFFGFSSLIAIYCLFSGENSLEQFKCENIFRW